MAAGLIVSGWFASNVISKLINELVDCAKVHKKKLGIKDELARLKTELPKIQAVMKDVDTGLIREVNEPLEQWLWQLRDAADQANDVMDEMEYYLLKKKVEAKSKVSTIKNFLERVGKKNPTLKKLKKAVKVINDVYADVEKLCMLMRDLVENQKETVKSATESHQTSSVLEVRTKAYGRVEEKKYIVSTLLNPERKTKEVNFAVLPIIGAGGVGKTTLAQLVYNDPEVEKYFELRMWVCVSNNFDVVLLTKKLYERLFDQNADFDNFDLIRTKIEKKLMSKRFLVVFDDAWNDDVLRWEKLFAHLKSGMSGSMILLTTRMETVARLTGPNQMDPVFLKGLNEDDMWNLFKECAFGDRDTNNHKKLVEIGRGIVNKLQGFPLAAKTVGRILQSDLSVRHWTDILESELWSLEMKGPNDIMPALRLSYQYLPTHLKPCFSFCSIFPQDHVFIKDDLIYMWLALGLVPRDFSGAKRPEDIVSKYFQDMLSRLIFSPADPLSNAHLHYPVYTYCTVTEKQFVGGYIMHDLMHDLSTFVSQGECFRSNTEKLARIPPTVRHLFIHVDDCCRLSNLNLENLKNVRTLILHLDDSNHPQLHCIVNEILKGMKSLRLLTLFALKLSEIPESASHLLHLRYLSLSSFMLGAFPRSIARLYLLETMVCGGFGFNGQADVLVKLINLRHLVMSESFVTTIAGLGRLTSLQELCFCVGRGSGFKICELRDMRELRRLSISSINNIRSQEEVIQANLRDKVSLSELTLQWDTAEFDGDVLDGLEPHAGLKELRIRNYMGGKPPVWLRTQSLSELEVLSFESMPAMEEWSLTQQPNIWMQCLKELIVDDCPKLCVLPPLPVSLKKLKLKRLGLVVLPNLWEDQSSETGSLPSLVKIEISDCQNLISLDEGLLRNPDKFVAFEELTITDCKELKMPQGGFNKFITLKRLDISGCPKIKLLYVHVLFLPPTLQFLRINNYVEDIQADMSLQSAPTLQTEEAKLVVLDHPGEYSNMELRYSRMRDYIGRWPPIWLTQTLSMLEYLIIDGTPSTRNIYSIPDAIDPLLEIINQRPTTRYPSLEMAYPSDMPVLELTYLASQPIKWMQHLKKLTVALFSKSCIMPPLPITLKELRLSYLGLVVVPNICENQSSESGSLPCLVSMEISDCPSLVSLAEGLFQKPQQFAALEKLTIRNCKELMNLPHYI